MKLPEGAVPTATPFRVAVLTCQDFVWETVAALSAVPELTVVGVVRAPLPRSPLKARLKRTWRRDGLVGVLAAVGRVALRRLVPAHPVAPSTTPVAGVPVHEVTALNSEECRTLLRTLALDLGILDGTNILKPETFSIPRLGCVNLHCGRLPQYRGAPPAFWELMAGEREVGVTVHQVSAELDAGAIYAEGARSTRCRPVTRRATPTRCGASSAPAGVAAAGADRAGARPGRGGGTSAAAVRDARQSPPLPTRDPPAAARRRRASPR
ncbi:MAG: hypothetical protein IPF47_23000 [Gemmatimonadetes bacterium]|nr:hypothetical protein [Gemmatimonadota bacterium]